MIAIVLITLFSINIIINLIFFLIFIYEVIKNPN